MQYTIDTLNIEIARLHKAVRKLKKRPPEPEQEQAVETRIAELEGQVRELRKAISVLKQSTRDTGSQFTSRLADPDNK